MPTSSSRRDTGRPRICSPGSTRSIGNFRPSRPSWPDGCAIAIPDINQALRSTNGHLNARTLWRLLGRSRHIDQARLLLLGVAAEYRSHGLYPLMLFDLHRQMAPAYRRVEFSWVLEDNQNI